MYWYLSHQVGLCEMLFWESATPTQRVEAVIISRMDRRALRKRGIGFLLHFKVRRAPRNQAASGYRPDGRSHNIKCNPWRSALKTFPTRWRCRFECGALNSISMWTGFAIRVGSTRSVLTFDYHPEDI